MFAVERFLDKAPLRIGLRNQKRIGWTAMLKTECSHDVDWQVTCLRFSSWTVVCNVLDRLENSCFEIRRLMRACSKEHCSKHDNLKLIPRFLGRHVGLCYRGLLV